MANGAEQWATNYAYYQDFDLGGNPTVSYDANPATPDIHTVYDQMNRPVERRAGSAGGTLLDQWIYDAPGEKGLLDRTISYDPTFGAITVDVTSYDGRQRPTGRSWTVPAGAAGAVAGTYTVLPDFDSTGNPISYVEHTVNPRPPGGSLDGSRVVIGSDGSAWATTDHFTTWTRIR